VADGTVLRMIAQTPEPAPLLEGTPNCVLCDRYVEHATCEVLRLSESGWVRETVRRLLTHEPRQPKTEGETSHGPRSQPGALVPPA